MSTTEVSPEQLDHMAGEIRALAAAFDTAHPTALQACGLTGRALVERAYEAFDHAWSRYVVQCADEVATMSDLVDLAAEAYHRQDGKVAEAAAKSATIRVGGR